MNADWIKELINWRKEGRNEWTSEEVKSYKESYAHI